MTDTGVIDTFLGTFAGIDAMVVPPDRIHAADADIFAPCALGAGLNAATIPALGARLICGGANNQLAGAEDAARLRARGIVYCPDYLANAGGIVELHHQRSGGGGAALAAHLATLADTLVEVLDGAAREGEDTNTIADRIVAARLERRA